MNSRYAPLVPAYVQSGFAAWYAYDGNDEKYEAFAGRWGGLSSEHFLRALEQGPGDDRLCAMCVLGASDQPETTHVLFPFLDSVRQDERCISAIVLGKRHDPRAFPFLERLLLEGLSLEERREASSRKERVTLEGFYVCDRFRFQAVELLDTWQSPTLIETIIQALEALWRLERALPRFAGEEHTSNTLCYALGQRHAFSALSVLDGVPVYQKIARVYMVLGALQAQPEPTYMRFVLKHAERLQNVLAETFHLDLAEAHTCIEAFYQERSIRRAYRAGMDESVMEERLAAHGPFMLDAPASEGERAQEESETPAEELPRQQEPVRVRVYREHTQAIWSVAWSPDGTHIVSGSADATAQVWDWQTGKRHCLFREHQSCVTVVAWSPDGQWIASGGCDALIYIWNAQTGEVRTTYEKHQAWICNGLAWSPDGQGIASASWDGTVHVWEAMTGKTRFCYRGHQGVVTSVAWSPDGTQIVSGGGYPEAAIHVWNAMTGQQNVLYQAHMQDNANIRPIPQEVFADDEAWVRGASSLRSVEWSPDGKWIASVGLRNVFRIWDARTGEDLIARFQTRTDGPLAWSTQSNYLATGYQNGVDIWSIEQKRILLTYIPVRRQKLTTLAWSPDRRMFVAGGQNALISVCNIERMETDDKERDRSYPEYRCL